ncbi:hypothetical protein F5Y14DRAFT_400916 [Nemania sp. NC0429]|nr:hypothetical protein F5Y14DRAFT_400916 [Nemania sp. NC0429]
MSALFNFQSLLLVILLLICTSAYVHTMFPTILDRNKQGCVPYPKLGTVEARHKSWS